MNPTPPFDISISSHSHTHASLSVSSPARRRCRSRETTVLAPPFFFTPPSTSLSRHSHCAHTQDTSTSPSCSQTAAATFFIITGTSPATPRQSRRFITYSLSHFLISFSVFSLNLSLCVLGLPPSQRLRSSLAVIDSRRLRWPLLPLIYAATTADLLGNRRSVVAFRLVQSLLHAAVRLQPSAVVPSAKTAVAPLLATAVPAFTSRLGSRSMSPLLFPDPWPNV